MSDVYDLPRPWCSLCQAEHSPCEYHDDGVEFWFFTPAELGELVDPEPDGRTGGMLRTNDRKDDT